MAIFARPYVLGGAILALILAHLAFASLTGGGTNQAPPIPVAAASNDDYWGGYIATAGPYSSVSATWTVPQVPCSAGTPGLSTAYVWVGEGGYLRGITSRLIQAGTASDCFAGAPRYHAFYEWYPGIYANDVPIDLRPGDAVTVRVSEQAPGYWVLSLRNDTTQQKSTTATVDEVDTGSADFIVERPTLCSEDWSCSQVPLAKFGAVTFRDARVTDARGGVLKPGTAAQAMDLVNPANGRVLAVPALARGREQDLAVVWRNGS